MLKQLYKNKQNFTNIPSYVGPSEKFIMFVVTVAAESGNPKTFSLRIKIQQFMALRAIVRPMTSVQTLVVFVIH